MNSPSFNSIQTYVTQHISYFINSEESASQSHKTPSQCILLLHCLNRYYGLVCNGLLEDDPSSPDFDQHLPEWWDSSELISFRYLDKNKMEIYVKYICVNDVININGMSATDNSNIQSSELGLSEFDDVDLNEVDKTIQKLKLKYFNIFLKHFVSPPPSSKAQESSTAKSNPLLISEHGPQFMPYPYGTYGVRPQNPYGPQFMGGDNPFGESAFGIDNYIGPNSGMFGVRPSGGANIRYDPPVFGSPDDDMFYPPGMNPNPNFRPGGGGGGFGGPSFF